MSRRQCRTGRTPACILLDFLCAFPSLALAWMWRALRVMSLNDGLRNMVAAMYDELETQVPHMGCRLQPVHIRRGIKRVCPMSRALYALAADTLVRAYLSKITVDIARVALFADDVVVVMRSMSES